MSARSKPEAAKIAIASLMPPLMSQGTSITFREENRVQRRFLATRKLQKNQIITRDFLQRFSGFKFAAPNRWRSVNGAETSMVNEFQVINQIVRSRLKAEL